MPIFLYYWHLIAQFLMLSQYLTNIYFSFPDFPSAMMDTNKPNIIDIVLLLAFDFNIIVITVNSYFEKNSSK